MRKIIKYVLFCTETILIFLFVGAMTTAITKNVYSRILVEEFKSKGVLNEEKSTKFTKIYEIESNEVIPTYTYYGTKIAPGNKGDIIISLTSEVEIPAVKEFISFFAGGHASLVLDEFGDDNIFGNSNRVVETTGLNPDNNLSIIGGKNYWISNSIYDEVLVVRVKMTDKERKKVISKGVSLFGDPYNFSFIVDTKNKSYCSDLVNKAFSSIGVNLNKDGFTTSVYDLVVSNETYISYYHYFDKEGIKHIYYLV